MHHFLIHKRGDHVGVATTDIRAGEKVTGIYLDDDSVVEIVSLHDIPLGHKIAIRAAAPGDKVLKYGIPIGHAPQGFSAGEYVHTHNLKTLRW